MEDLLLQAERAARSDVRLIQVQGEVTGILKSDAERPLAAHFSDRPPILADFMILALGNPPSRVPSWAAAVREHSAFRQDPRDLPTTLSAEHSILIVGNGLTMVDAAAVLSRDDWSKRYVRARPVDRVSA